MKVAMAQLPAGTDKAANLQTIARMTREAGAAGADLVLFPECSMFDPISGAPLSQIAEPIDGPFASGLSSLARAHGLVLLAGMFESIPGSELVFNTVVAFGPDGGLLGLYHKIHLYDAFGYRESDTVEPGDGSTLIFVHGGMTFGVQICFDVRFPELSRHLVESGANCLLIPTAWAAGLLKEMQWEALVRARAIENTVYVAGAGLVGSGNCGGSMVVDPMGVPVARAADGAGVIVGELDGERVARVREVNPCLLNMRPDVYRLWSLQTALTR